MGKYATILVLILTMLLAGCTATQWESTRDVLGAVAILSLAVAIEAQPAYYVPPVTTRCQTVCSQFGTGCVSTCTTY
jgi:hypothetical protein